MRGEGPPLTSFTAFQRGREKSNDQFHGEETFHAIIAGRHVVPGMGSSGKRNRALGAGAAIANYLGAFSMSLLSILKILHLWGLVMGLGGRSWPTW